VDNLSITSTGGVDRRDFLLPVDNLSITSTGGVDRRDFLLPVDNLAVACVLQNVFTLRRCGGGGASLLAMAASLHPRPWHNQLENHPQARTIKPKKYMTVPGVG
jgi:hypothetical protein